MLSFYKQQSYFSQIVSKKAKITIYIFLKYNNIILGFSFIYLGSVYPMNRTIIVKVPKNKIENSLSDLVNILPHCDMNSILMIHT